MNIDEQQDEAQRTSRVAALAVIIAGLLFLGAVVWAAVAGAAVWAGLFTALAVVGIVVAICTDHGN